jgi:hypothetical protein
MTGGSYSEDKITCQIIVGCVGLIVGCVGAFSSTEKKKQSTEGTDHSMLANKYGTINNLV